MSNKRWVDMLDNNNAEIELKQPIKNEENKLDGKHYNIYNCVLCRKQFYEHVIFYDHVYRDHTISERKRFFKK